MPEPRVSFIICTYNRDPYIERALHAVANQKCDSSLFELILIDNLSTDQTAAISLCFASDFSKIKYYYFLEENQGLSHARNRGLKEAKGEILVFLDDDAFIDENYCANLLKFYDKNLHIYCTGGKTIPLFEAGKPKWMSHFLMPLVAAIDLGDEAKAFPFNQFPIGANMAMRKKMSDRVGLFDTNLGRKGKNLQGGEEKDYFNRARAKGFIPWYLPSTIAQHIIPASRMSIEYIRKQAKGIGYSERIRVQSIGKMETWKKYFSEWMKWVISGFLFLFYFITFQFPKAIMIVRFRNWVSKGLFFAAE